MAESEHGNVYIYDGEWLTLKEMLQLRHCLCGGDLVYVGMGHAACEKCGLEYCTWIIGRKILDGKIK